MIKRLRRFFHLGKFVKTTYLAGPMDDVSIEESRVWREMLSVELPKLGIGVLNPVQKYGDDYGNMRKRFANWRKSGNVDAIREVTSTQIIPPDLKMVKKCDFITLRIPADNCEICGSYGEITYAFILGKPVYIVTARRMKPLNIPKWAIGCSTKVFKTWDEYFEYLKTVVIPSG